MQSRIKEDWASWQRKKGYGRHAINRSLNNTREKRTYACVYVCTLVASKLLSKHFIIYGHPKPSIGNFTKHKIRVVDFSVVKSSVGLSIYINRSAAADGQATHMSQIESLLKRRGERRIEKRGKDDNGIKWEWEKGKRKDEDDWPHKTETNRGRHSLCRSQKKSR